jgi:putative membrane protein insertion efficiency factor
MSALAKAIEKPHVRVALLARVLIVLVRAYQLLLRPFLGGQCRFEPSCSRYAVACLETQGALRGSLLSVKRLCKCHPFHPGGHDPPPGEA